MRVPVRLLGLLQQAEAIEEDSTNLRLFRVLLNVIADQHGDSRSC